MKIPISSITFPFVLIIQLIGFAIGIALTGSLIGLALAGATEGFGWRPKILSGKKVNPKTWKYEISYNPGWYLRLFGAKSGVGTFYSLNQRDGWTVVTSEGTEIFCSWLNLMNLWDQDSQKQA